MRLNLCMSHLQLDVKSCPAVQFDGLYFLKLTKYLDRTGEHIYLQNASNWDSN